MKSAIFLFLFFNFINIYSQSSFNEQNGLLISTQLKGVSGISSIVGYKSGRILYITGYDIEKFQHWDTNRRGLKLGIQVYPHKNVRQLKVFYQSLVSYKWHGQEDPTKLFLLQSGSGLDWFFKENISIGYNFSIGFGQMKDKYDSQYEFTIDWFSAITFKYFLFINRP